MMKDRNARSARVVSIASLATLAIAALGACSNLGALPQNNPSLGSQRFDYVLSEKITSNETVQSLEDRLGGRVFVYRPEAGFAVVGFRKGDAGLSNPDIAARLEVNQAVFLQRPKMRTTGMSAWTGGMSAWTGGMSAWTGGMSAWTGGMSAWTGGMSAWTGGMSAWTGGQYNPIPQNTATWQQIRLEQGQALAPNLGAGVKVAVLDTGIDTAHPAFNGSLLTNDMWDFIGNDANPQEEGTAGQGGFGHGTNVAGIVVQVALASKILPLRVLGADGSGDISGVVAAIDYAVSKGVKVINMSLGTSEPSQAIEDALNLAAAQGVYVVASAGNDNVNTPTYPAANFYNDATASGAFGLSVGSVNSSDQKSGFSNFGTSPKPLEIVAPGETVYAPAPGNQMSHWSGTSMATPMVSGALALALGEQLNVSGATLSTKVKTKVDGIYANGNNAAYVNLLGQGRLNIEQLITDVKQP
jgi:thermitase